MELWKLTFKQYDEWCLETSKYKEKYLEKPTLWESLKIWRAKDWENILLLRAEEGPIPSKVLQSYIRVFGEPRMKSQFRGIRYLGIQDYRIPKKIRELRNSPRPL